MCIFLLITNGEGTLYHVTRHRSPTTVYGQFLLFKFCYKFLLNTLISLHQTLVTNVYEGKTVIIVKVIMLVTI